MFEYSAKLVRIIDADTLELDVDLGFKIWHRMVVRLDGLDAPERKSVGHKSALDWLTIQVTGKGPLKIRTKKDKQEKFGRYLAEVFYSTDTPSINQQMIAVGYAVAYQGGKR